MVLFQNAKPGEFHRHDKNKYSQLHEGKLPILLRHEAILLVSQGQPEERYWLVSRRLQRRLRHFTIPRGNQQNESAQAQVLLLHEL